MAPSFRRVVLFSAVLLCGAFAGLRALGQGPGGLSITEVYVDLASEEIVVTVENPRQSPLQVLLGDSAFQSDISSLCSTDVSLLPQQIICDLSADGLPEAGDYVLTLSPINPRRRGMAMGPGGVSHDLTIGLAGPRGPAGSPGPDGDAEAPGPRARRATPGLRALTARRARRAPAARPVRRGLPARRDPRVRAAPRAPRARPGRSERRVRPGWPARRATRTPSPHSSRGRNASSARTGSQRRPSAPRTVPSGPR
jgi:hypothetical protein